METQASEGLPMTNWKHSCVNLDFISTRDRHPRRTSYLGVVVTLVSIGLVCAYATVSLVALNSEVVRTTQIVPAGSAAMTDVRFTCTCISGCLIAFPPGDCSYAANAGWRDAHTPPINITGVNIRTAARWVPAGSVHDFRLCTRSVGLNGIIVMGAEVLISQYSTSKMFRVGQCVTGGADDIGFVHLDNNGDAIHFTLDQSQQRNIILRREDELAADGSIASTRLGPQTETIQDCAGIDTSFNHSAGVDGWTQISGYASCTGISIDSTVIRHSTLPSTTIWVTFGNIGGAANFIYTIAYGIMALYARCVYQTQWPPHDDAQSRGKG
jgi:hypothetical protein